VNRRPPSALAAGLCAALLAGLPAPASAVEKAQWGPLASAHVKRFLRYPAAERRARQEGRALVRFRVDRAGRVSDPSIVESAGRPALDRAALAAVRAADPLPPPDWLPDGDTVTATLPVAFRR